MDGGTVLLRLRLSQMHVRHVSEFVELLERNTEFSLIVRWGSSFENSGTVAPGDELVVSVCLADDRVDSRGRRIYDSRLPETNWVK